MAKLKTLFTLKCVADFTKKSHRDACELKTEPKAWNEDRVVACAWCGFCKVEATNRVTDVFGKGKTLEMEEAL
jgi:hypothetical protein